MKNLLKFQTRKVDTIDVNTEELNIRQYSFNKLGIGKVTETDLSFTKIGSETIHRPLNKRLFVWQEKHNHMDTVIIQKKVSE